jgi:hypothetical protein
MDPVARRFMWKVIAEVATRDKQTSIVLTTHSMEECEALCQRVGIMVGGRLKCLGSVQHLKSRFGQGFQAEIKLKEATMEAKNEVVNRIMTLQAGTEFAGATTLTRAHLQELCTVLGAADRFPQISETGSGWALDAAFEKSELPTPGLPARSPQRAIPVTEFASWWAGEDAVAGLINWLCDEAFPGAVLLERQGSQLRFQLPPQREPLGVMFAKVEGVTGRFGIQSYALGQTTLEQIFNGFAREQEVRGEWGGGGWQWRTHGKQPITLSPCLDCRRSVAWPAALRRLRTPPPQPPTTPITATRVPPPPAGWAVCCRVWPSQARWKWHPCLPLRPGPRLSRQARPRPCNVARHAAAAVEGGGMQRTDGATAEGGWYLWQR